MYERKVVPPPAAARDAIAAGPGQAPNGPAAPRPSPAPGVGGPGLARVQQGQRAGPWPALTRRGRRSQVRPPPCLSGSGPGTLRPAASVTRRCRPSRVQPKLGHHKECAVCAPCLRPGRGVRAACCTACCLFQSRDGRRPAKTRRYLRCSCRAGALVRHWPCLTQDAARPREASRAANSVGSAATLPVSCLLLLMFAGS